MTDLYLNFSPSDRNARYVRDEIRDWARLHTLSSELTEETLLVTSELFSNAVRASTGPTITVNVALADNYVAVEVINLGKGFNIDQLPAANQHTGGGRGIAIIRTLGAMTVLQNGRETQVQVIMRTDSSN